MWNLVHTDAEKKATTDKPGRHLLSTEQEMAWDTGIARTRDSGNSIHFLRQFSSYAQVIIQNLSVTCLIISWRVDKNRQLRNQGMPETEDKHFFQHTDLLFEVMIDQIARKKVIWKTMDYPNKCIKITLPDGTLFQLTESGAICSGCLLDEKIN